MPTHVYLEIPFLDEAFRADAATVRFLAGVTPQVYVQVAPLYEPLAADFASVRLLPGVPPHVDVQASYGKHGITVNRQLRIANVQEEKNHHVMHKNTHTLMGNCNDYFVVFKKMTEKSERV